MAVTKLGENGFVATGVHIEIYRLRVLASGIRLEMKGMRKRGRQCSTIVREEFGFRGSLVSLVEQLDKRCEELEGSQ
jgi:hypothetical protein